MNIEKPRAKDMRCLILDILVLYGCRSPRNTESNVAPPSSNVPVMRYIDELGEKQYKILVSNVQYEKYSRSARDYESRYREVSPILRMLMLNKAAIKRETGKDVQLEELKELIPDKGKIHSEEYQGLLSVIEKRFIRCECDKLIICLDNVLRYDRLFNALKKHLKDKLDQCSIGLTKRVENGAEVYCFEKVP